MESINSRKEYPWIDTAKSIAIFLVVWGHFQNCGTFSILQRLIYSFHVPLFFILSGFLYKHKDGEPFIVFIKKKFLRIALPALLWILISVPMFIWYYRKYSPLRMLRSYFAQIFYGSVPINLPCWFFLSLFTIFLLVRMIRIHRYSNVINVFLALIVFSAAYFLYHFGIPDYFMLIKTLVCLGFFIIGYTARNTKILKDESAMKGFRPAVILVSFLFWILSSLILNEKVTVYGVDFGNYWIFILSALTGTFFFCEILRLCCNTDPSKRKELLERYPVHASVFIVCSHYPIILPFFLVMRSADLLSTRTYDLVASVIFIALFIVYYPLSKLVSKYAPFLNGEPSKDK